MNVSIKKASQLLASVRGTSLSRKERIEQACDLATYLVAAAQCETTHREKVREKMLANMMEDHKGRVFITHLTDRCFRSSSSKRTADELLNLIRKYGIPQFLDEGERLKFMIFHLLGKSFAHFFVKRIRRQVRRELESVLLPQNAKERASYFERCRKDKVLINLNNIGEEVLGEKEAQRRLQIYLDDLAHREIEYISVKISTLYSQINMIGWNRSLEIVAGRLRALYRAAKAQSKEKFVNLDMEEYRDLDLTVALFQKVLNEDEFLTSSAGIALQSYLPESFRVQQELTAWASERMAKGGVPIKIRLVKGANLSMELVQSSQSNWELPPFDTKGEVDANFKRMLEYALEPSHARCVHIGMGSHNLFDIAYALILRAENKLEEAMSFEMLEGMAEPMRRVVHKLSGTMVLYCPEAKEASFQHAVAYLIRRLEENAGRENFLRHFFALKPGNQVWAELEKGFIEACGKIDHLPFERRRKQNRGKIPSRPHATDPFHNEPDTDFSLAENRQWAQKILVEWREKTHPDIPLVIGGEEIITTLAEGRDPSRPNSPLYHYSLADEKLAKHSVESAHVHRKQWERVSLEERSSLLSNVAHLFRQRRGELIGAMVADGGKTIWQADPEVSEAIDFIEYYRKNWEKITSFSDLSWSPKGTVLVASPWNFPLSIPVSGIAAALTAGNSVLFKPAPEAVLVGWHLVRLFWEGGIPKEVLHFVNCVDEPVGSALIQEPALSSVILTGATETARKFLKMRPSLDLHGETGGKNALIVTAMCDRDLAIRDLVHSAYGHSGQKCSACSLAVLEEELYDDVHFLGQLADAVESLYVGSAWDENSQVTPLIRPPGGVLKRGLTELEEGETWLVQPRPVADNPHLWRPGVKLGVRENSFTHQTELFGPVLGIMRASSLKEAIHFVNTTAYGLTSGLHSLDEREHAYWKENIVAGNLYINRSITGAIVRRQPFGGCKASSFGPGAKAGGPNYVLELATPSMVALPHEQMSLPSSVAPLIGAFVHFDLSEEEITIWKKSAQSYAYWADILKEPSDPSALLGQDNYFYHIPLTCAYLRLESGYRPLPLLQVVAGCLICKTPLKISSQEPLTPFEKIPGLEVLLEDEPTFLQRMTHIKSSRIRLLTTPTERLLKVAADIGATLQQATVMANGRIELLHYMREITLSVDFHRYGYLGERDPGFN